MVVAIILAASFTVIALIISALSFWKIELAIDIPNLNTEYETLDTPCRDHMQSISLMPAWRRNLLCSVIIAVIVTSFTVASFSACRQLKPHQIRIYYTVKYISCIVYDYAVKIEF